MSTTIQVTFDARDPQALSRFWAEAMGYVSDPEGNEFCLDGPAEPPPDGAQRAL